MQPKRSAQHRHRAHRHQESLRIWRPPHCDSLELRVGTRVQHSYPRHWHDEFFISAITAGAGHFVHYGIDQLATPGTLVFVAPGDVHARHDCAGGRSFRSLHIAPSFVQQLNSALLQDEAPLSTLPSALLPKGIELPLFLRLHECLEKSQSALHCESRMLEFFAQLRRTFGPRRRSLRLPRSNRFAIRRSLQFLHEYYDRCVSLTNLAALADMSPYHFHRVFSASVGMPPHAYQIQLRIMQAKRLIRKFPLSMVAATTGFTDQSHFTRHFKRVLGVTPAQYLGASKNVQDL
jgi:AraC-like DNA-binding protein